MEARPRPGVFLWSPRRNPLLQRTRAAGGIPLETVRLASGFHLTIADWSVKRKQRDFFRARLSSSRAGSGFVFVPTPPGERRIGVPSRRLFFNKHGVYC